MILVGLALAVSATILFCFNPAQYGFYPRCQLYALTGLQCPTCGGLRAVHALLHGHLMQAFQLNPLFVLVLPVVTVFSMAWIMRKRRNPALCFIVPLPWVWAALAVFILFGIVRNLPGASAALGGQ